jgi:hypothetical protein
MNGAHVITIRTVDATTFEVSVEARSHTTHTVTVSPEYCRRLTGGRLSCEELVRRSFEFLLERESNTSILRRFDLAVIGRYFPEYESVMRRMPP